MSTNVRILRQIAESAESITKDYADLAAVFAPLRERVARLSALLAEARRVRNRRFVYTPAALSKDVVELVSTPLVKRYGSNVEAWPAPVIAMAKAARVRVNNRINGAASCQRPESVNEWTLDKLAGLEEEKRAVREGWIRPQQFPLLYKAASKGVLLYGPPGTGKTVLAKAMSNALPKVAFYSISAGSVKSKWLGETEERIQSKFDCAADILEERPDEYELAALFIDEIDSIGAKRSDEGGSAAASSTQALLVAMDGFFSSENVSVIGATNLPWALDDGLLRRFDERIFLDLPTLSARIGIILDAIVKYFAPPWYDGKREHSWKNDALPKPDRSKDQKTVYDAMLDASNYAGASEVTWNAFEAFSSNRVQIAAGGGGGKAVSEEALVGATTARIILEAARMMGPRDSSKKDMPHRTEEGEFYAKATSRFGYNASDIGKVMKKASVIAASKTFATEAYRGAWRPVPTDPSTPVYNDYYYSYFPRSADEDLPEDALSTSVILKRRPPVNARMLNFTLTYADIELAMREVGSSVNEENYLKLLEFKNKG